LIKEWMVPIDLILIRLFIVCCNFFLLCFCCYFQFTMSAAISAGLKCFGSEHFRLKTPEIPDGFRHLQSLATWATTMLSLWPGLIIYFDKEHTCYWSWEMNSFICKTPNIQSHLLSSSQYRMTFKGDIKKIIIGKK